jgi:hypothetical protein
VLTTNPRGKQSNESLEVAMYVVERGITSLHGANNFRGIAITSFFDHLYGKAKSKKIGPPSVLTQEEDEAIFAWVLSM